MDPRVMAASALDSEPIEREERENSVVYKNIKLVSEGVWTDQASKTPTLYDETTFENTEAKYSGEYDGPPVNISHDIHKEGRNKGEPHEASIGGYIDPDSLQTDGTALYGDIVLEKGNEAGEFADVNLKSGIESGGSAGFSPSIEITPTQLESVDHPEAQEHVKAAELTGTGLVRDPASKDVDMAYETQNRAVAMAASSKESKALYLKNSSMSDELDIEALREQYELSDGVDEDTIKELAEADALLMEDEDRDMVDDMDTEEIMSAVQAMRERVEDLEDQMSSMMSEGDVEEELESATEDLETELSELKETNKELSESKDDLEKRLATLEEEPKDPKTLADTEEVDNWDWSEAEGTPQTNNNAL